MLGQGIDQAIADQGLFDTLLLPDNQFHSDGVVILENFVEDPVAIDIELPVLHHSQVTCLRADRVANRGGRQPLFDAVDQRGDLLQSGLRAVVNGSMMDLVFDALRGGIGKTDDWLGHALPLTPRKTSSAGAPSGLRQNCVCPVHIRVSPWLAA